MTREEAKHRLLDIERCTPIHTREDVRDFEALEMAIKALEQEPMRDATPEERESVDKYVKSISKPTGVNYKALEQVPCDDAISKQAILDWFCKRECGRQFCDCRCDSGECDDHKALSNIPSINPQEPRWIPVSERMPEELEPVNITWVNHNPESYYADIKDKPFTATGVYFNGQWYWWSTLCTDILAEYSHNYDDIIHDDIEITAWMPLPGPYTEKMKKMAIEYAKTNKSAMRYVVP